MGITVEVAHSFLEGFVKTVPTVEDKSATDVAGGEFTGVARGEVAYSTFELFTGLAEPVALLVFAFNENEHTAIGRMEKVVGVFSVSVFAVDVVNAVMNKGDMVGVMESSSIQRDGVFAKSCRRIGKEIH